MQKLVFHGGIKNQFSMHSQDFYAVLLVTPFFYCDSTCNLPVSGTVTHLKKHPYTFLQNPNSLCIPHKNSDIPYQLGLAEWYNRRPTKFRQGPVFDPPGRTAIGGTIFGNSRAGDGVSFIDSGPL